MTAEEEITDIEALIQAVADLTVDQRNLLTSQLALQHQINELRIIVSDRTSASVSDTDPESRIAARTRFYIDDQVTIRNPRRGQGNRGFIIGFTNTGFVRVQLYNPSGLVIRRLPRNLTPVPVPIAAPVADTVRVLDSDEEHEQQ